MRLLFSTSLLIVMFTGSSKACLNEYYTRDKEGTYHDANPMIGFNTNFNSELIAQKLKKLSIRLDSTHDFRVLSDYTVLLMKGGKAKDALEILIELFKHYPNEYIIVANLGTAYELNGEVDSVLKYISLDMELNPMDHEGSEWVHKKVLETKLKLKKEPNYLSTHTVLGLTEKEEHYDANLTQLEIQVRERFPFTPGPDNIMASLLLDLGDLYSNTKSVVYAEAIYNVALNYYGDKSLRLKNKIAKTSKIVDEQSKKQDINTAGRISYKNILDDNNKDHYLIDWKNIPTAPRSLISKVDFSIKSGGDPDKLDSNKKTIATKYGMPDTVAISGYFSSFLISTILSLLVLTGGIIFFFLKKNSGK